MSMSRRTFVRVVGGIGLTSALPFDYVVGAEESESGATRVLVEAASFANRGTLSLRYHGGAILDAEVALEDRDGKRIDVPVKMEPKTDEGEKVAQRLTFTPAQPRERATLVLCGTVAGSKEAFPAETLGDAQNRFPCVRNSAGMSRSLRNNAVYDRRWDWVLIGPGDGR